MNILRTLFMATLFSVSAPLSAALAQGDTCAGYPKVSGFNSELKNVCLGLVRDSSQINWRMPRRLLFVSPNQLLISDLGSWGNHSAGKVWQLDLLTGRHQIAYQGGDRTHGLAFDKRQRLLVGDAGRILRFKNNRWEVVIEDLPTEGKHALSHLLVLPSNDIIVNVGAPSDRCLEEMGSGYDCPTRDKEAELRLFAYNSRGDNYLKNYQVLARGLRNSMALLYNPQTGDIYQGENNMDVKGTPEEFNVITAGTFENDFGWPFCFGHGTQAPGLNASFLNFCTRRSQAPLFLIPPHSAPLDMSYVEDSTLFPELNGVILMPWHGHTREVENALVAYETNALGEPIVHDSDFNPFIKVLSGYNSHTGEKLRPVGIAFDQKGQIWFADDSTKKLYVVSRSKSSQSGEPLTGPTKAESDLKFVNSLSSEALRSFDQVYKPFYSRQTCTSCHGTQILPQNSKAALLALLGKNWLVPGQPTNQMPFIYRMNPSTPEALRMPPTPAKAFGAKYPQTFENLKRWVETYL